jgi:hypothetical protein
MAGSALSVQGAACFQGRAFFVLSIVCPDMFPSGQKVTGLAPIDLDSPSNPF